MKTLTAAAWRLFDSKEVPMPMVSLEVTASLSSPAISMRGTFAPKQNPGKLGEIQVRAGKALLFEGRCDRQATSLSKDGLFVELEARSRGALLLDNEAQPCTLANVSLQTLFGLFIAPRGFSCYNPNPAFTLPLYAIRGGISEWEALCTFSRRAYGITPYVSAGQVMVCRPKSTASLLLGSGKGASPFASIKTSYTPYKMLSRVVLRDSTGAYQTMVENPSAPYHKIQRTRFVVPANEFVDQPALDASQKIRRSMLESEETTVLLPGLVEAAPGQEATVAHPSVELSNLVVEEVTWKAGPQGIFTRLSLVSSLYV